MAKILRATLWTVGGLTALALLGVGAVISTARTVGAPASLGVNDGRLAPCPDSPNCVSSQADPSDRKHFMQPLAYNGAAASALGRIREVIASQPRAELIVAQETYLHTVFRSATIGFPDDVEFFVDEQAGLIHFRAAARMGRDDLGVNRARMERLSTRLSEVLQ